MHDASEEVLCQVSERISKELEKKGYSSHKLKTKSSEVKLQEFIENMCNEGKEVYSTGSNTEGVSISGSDRDIMTVLGNVTVITSPDNSQIAPDSHTLFVMEQDNVRPCYTKLKLFRESIDKSDHFHRLGGRERLCVKDSNGNWYFSSAEFASGIASSLPETFQSSAAHELSPFHVHGPSATWKNMVSKVMFDVDTVYCLRCPFLPSGIRFRPYQDGHLNIGQLFEKMGCHLVPVGDRSSVETHLEWRISFALIEREMIWNFNDIQVKCYVLLKAILKEHIESIAEDELSSYAIKTCLFWLTETEDASFWREENLLKALQTCLRKITLHVKEKMMPHFIVPENNILLTKFGDDQQHSVVLERLQTILEWQWTDFLKLQPLRNLCQILETFGHDVQNFLRSSRFPNIITLFYKDLVSFRSFQTLYINIHTYEASKDYYTKLSSHLQRAPADIDPSLIKFLLCVVENRIHYMTRDAASCTARNDHFDTGNHFLRNAIINLTSNRLDQSLADVEDFLSAYKLHVLYIGLCGPEEAGQFEAPAYLCYVTSAGDMTCFQKVTKCLALDFVVCKVDLFPPFLQPILELWDEESVPILVHPKVMAYYLLLLILYQTGKTEEASLCLISLSENVRDADKKADSIYSSIAWCLLGHAFFLMQKRRFAYRSFKLSLRKKLKANPSTYFIGNC